ncbi:Fe-S cluster assembly protein SufD [Steroidobacter sp. S1-65]|uniref:Fe-S cluster assembly protein SufD n=1 Tax=Steroidobacter gossypii TaxID=2805490 RepID=A0ABS1X1H7_9GAMM|nr:Fe-S cluster assembly protein SufD [Steroidobacter gossypii]MBM0107080.1 Fe-S cluster assembly protein SufD [Steroidobacter gossypii]
MSTVAAKNTVSPLERYKMAFESRWQGNDELTALRHAALEQFLSAGFPTQRDEAWKYTNLRRLESRSFTPAETSALDAHQPEWLATAGTRIVLVNGHCLPALSSQVAQPPGVTVLTFKQWIEHEPAAVAAYLKEQDQLTGNALEQLNLAFFEDGVVVNLADNTILDEPVYIVHQSTSSAAQRMSHPRIVVRAGRNARATIIEHYLGANDAEYFTNAVTRFDIAAGGAVKHFRVQQESPRAFHIGHVQTKLAKDARFSIHDIALGASLGRSGITALLEGTGAHAALFGLFAPMGNQHLDAHTRLDHIAAHTTSEEDYRGIAGGRARGVFNGKVIVRPDAQKIDARQSSRNLLLSPTAEIDTKPELEIYANDVKCSHGATTGQLDATALFYLRSRGLSESDARAALIRAFAESILATIDLEPVHAALEKQIDERFKLVNEAKA